MSWGKKTLDQLGSVARGKSKHRPRNDERLFGGDYPFIQTADVKESGLYLTNYSQTYNEFGLKQSKLWPAGTLCITIAANIAETAILGMDACFPDSIMGFLPFEGISDVRYVKYCFDMLQRECKQISQGTTQDNLSWEKLSTITFLVPSYDQQVKIADILSAYDDLIENNKKQIKLLEEAAQRLYKEWFVALHFPGYENTKIIDGVPEGWTLGKLMDIAEITMGQSPKSEFFNRNKEGLPFHQGVGSYGERFVKNEVYSTDLTRIALSQSILFSVRAPVGRLNITKEKIVIGRGLAAIYHKDGFQSFLFYLLKEYFYKGNLIGNGSIFSSITKAELTSLEVMIPNIKLAREFNEFGRKIDDMIQLLDSKIEQLSETRNRLLSKLMNEEVEI